MTIEEENEGSKFLLDNEWYNPFAYLKSGSASVM